MFRSYKSVHSSYNPTIVEAVRASWATPGLFSPAHLGAELMREEIISAVNGFNNPILEVIKEAKETLGVDRLVSSFLSLGAGQTQFRSVMSKDYVKKTAEDTEVIAREARRRFGRLYFYFRFSVDQGIDGQDAVGEATLGAIAAHTSVYLEADDNAQRLDTFLKISQSTSNITLSSIGEPLSLNGLYFNFNVPSTPTKAKNEGFSPIASPLRISCCSG